MTVVSPKAYCVANDFEQAQSRVFTVIKRIVEVSPLLKGEAKITADRITFPALDATIMAIASDAASAAGGNPAITLLRRIVGLHLGACDAAVGRDDHLACAQDQLPVDDDLCGLQRRERVAGGPAQARHGVARGWAELACWRRHAVRVAHRAGCAVAGRAMAGRDAAQPAAECLSRA